MSDLQTWDAWRDIHQPFELGWWQQSLKMGHSRDDAEFKRIWDEVKEFIQPRGKIIDIGCGPRPPFAPCVVIEPLATEYQKITPPEWWDGVYAYAEPAETICHGVRSDKTFGALRADTIICWNCIDHAVGWREILDNMLTYGGSDATYAIATDFHEPFVGHPGFTREEFYPEITRRFNVLDKREPFGRALALRMRAR